LPHVPGDPRRVVDCHSEEGNLEQILGPTNPFHNFWVRQFDVCISQARSSGELIFECRHERRVLPDSQPIERIQPSCDLSPTQSAPIVSESSATMSFNLSIYNENTKKAVPYNVTHVKVDPSVKEIRNVAFEIVTRWSK
jgi:hypothetical protein